MIKKGTILQVTHVKKGFFTGIVTRDFDNLRENFFPIALHQDQNLKDANYEWKRGEEIPCRSTLVTIKIV